VRPAPFTDVPECAPVEDPVRELVSAEPRLAIPPEPLPPPYPDLRQENEALRSRVAELAAHQACFHRDVIRASEKELIALACAMAERITRRELSTDPEIIIGWAREAITALGERERVVIALAPDLAARLSTVDWPALVGDGVRVETDASLGALKCEVRAGAATVDASLEGRLSSVSAALGGSEE
jgi:flagellar biosynthesis/type III secretory pathway protein FliH